eukprot:m.21533 g.21533  ORF g.21533 m.21533 type:complete len:56 (+) comp3931_c1_seq1:951-1118(+)
MDVEYAAAWQASQKTCPAAQPVGRSTASSRQTLHSPTAPAMLQWSPGQLPLRIES